MPASHAQHADAWKVKRTRYAATVNTMPRSTLAPGWTRVLVPACLLPAGLVAGRSADDRESTLSQVGQAAPTFTVTALDAKPFDLPAMKGRVVLLT